MGLSVSRLFQSIQDEAGLKAGVEQNAKRAVEVQAGRGLAEDADPTRDGRLNVSGYFHGVARDEFSILVFFFDDSLAADGVEARMRNGEDEAAVGLE